MKVNHHQVYKAVLTANFSSKEQKKALTQKQRDLLLLCCKVLPKAGDVAHTEVLAGKGRQINQLIKKLEQDANPKVFHCSNCISRVIASFFKGIANLLHLRLSSRRLNNQVHLASLRLSFNNRETLACFDMMSDLMKMRTVSHDKKHTAMKTIESFYLLSTHLQDDLLLLPNGNLSADLIKERIGLLTELDRNKIKKAGEVLMNKYAEAKRANILTEFFTQAFDAEDKTLEKRYERINNFNVPEKLQNRRKYEPGQPVPLDDLIRDGYHKYNKPNLNNFKLPDVYNPPVKEPDFFNPDSDKDETLFKMCQVFQDIQLYHHAKALKIEHLPLETIKEKILGKNDLRADFFVNYANTQNFEKYVKEKNVFGKNCKDGPLTLEDLPNSLENLVGMDMLGKVKEQDLDAPGDKQDTVFKYCQNFQKKKMRKYQQDNNFRYKGHPQPVVDQHILQQDNFFSDYANTKKFEKYLKKENIIGKKCTDGEIQQEDLPELMKHLVELGMLGEEEPPRIVRNNFVNRNPEPDQKKANPVVANIPIDPIGANEYAQLYEEMKNDVEKWSRNNNRAKETMHIIYMCYVHKEAILKLIDDNGCKHAEYNYKRDNGHYCGGLSYFHTMPGIPIHTENNVADTKDIVTSTPRILFEQYVKHKKTNRLDKLFGALQDNGGPCLEGHIRQLNDYLINNNLLENVNVELLLKPPLIPLVSDKCTKEQNMHFMVNIFRELQARKYYMEKNNKDKIPPEWIEEMIPHKAHIKGDIIANDDFQKNYNNKVNYIKFLKDEVKLLEGEKKASDGPFVEADLERLAQYCADLVLLEG